MKLTKRIPAILLTLAMLLALLVACTPAGDGEGTSGEVTTEGATSAEVTTDAATTEDPDGTEESGTTETGGETTGGELPPAEPMDLLNTDLSGYITLGKYKDVPISVKELDYRISLNLELYEQKFYETVESGDRTVREGDLILVDYTGYLDGTPFEGGAAQDQVITVYEGTGYIEGFASGFLGAKAGTDSEFNVTFPENYGAENLAGKEVTFRFTLKAIYEFAPLTDAQAETLSGGAHPTAASYETYKRNLLVQAKLWTDIVESATVKAYPEQQVEYYYRQMKDYYSYYAMFYGKTYEAFITEYLGITDADVRLSAELSTKGDLVYYAIVQTEGITVTDEEYAALYENYVNRYKNDFGYTDEQIESMGDALRGDMLYDKTQELLIAWADVTWE